MAGRVRPLDTRLASEVTRGRGAARSEGAAAPRDFASPRLYFVASAGFAASPATVNLMSPGLCASLMLLPLKASTLQV